MTNGNDRVESVAICNDRDERVYTNGLTKREYFAAVALQGLVASGTYAADFASEEAVNAVACADALIAALNKEQA